MKTMGVLQYLASGRVDRVSSFVVSFFPVSMGKTISTWDIVDGLHVPNPGNGFFSEVREAPARALRFCGEAISMFFTFSLGTTLPGATGFDTGVGRFFVDEVGVFVRYTGMVKLKEEQEKEGRKGLSGQCG